MPSLYPAQPRPSTLIPDQCHPDWTDLTQVLSDQPPGVAGTGAALLAQQALNLSPAAAAALVASTGGTNVSAGTLTNAVYAAMGGPPTAVGPNATRVPIPSNVNTAQPLIGGDANRTFLLVQNNNAAGGANLLVSVDGQINTATPAFYLNLAPGLGILFDEAVFGNPLYVAWASGTVAGGTVLFGTSAPSAPAGGNAAPAIFLPR